MTQPQLLIALLLMQQGLCALMWIVAAYLRLSWRAAAHWAGATALVSVAMVLILQRGQLPPWLTVGLSNLILVIGLLLLRRGVQKFCRLATTDRESALIALGYAAGLGVLVGEGAPIAPVAVMGSLTVSWIFVRLGLDVQRGLAQESGRVAAAWCAAPAYLIAAVFVARLVLILVRGSPTDGSLEAQSTVNLLITMAMMLFGLVVNGQLLTITVLRLVVKLRRQTERDPLTELYNRRAMERLIEHESERQKRLGSDFALLSVDIDHFKRINDQYGHGVGDQVLCRVATCLRQGCRSIDQVARMGGEEFWILLPGAGREESLVVGERLLGQVRALEFGDIATGLRVTISIGQASAKMLEEPMDLLLRRLDLALYEAKGSGRDRLVPAVQPL